MCPSKEVIDLDLRPCPGMHTSIPRCARHSILIPHWTAIKRVETIGLPTAIQTSSALIDISQAGAARPHATTPCPDKTSTPRRFLSVQYRSCQLIVSGRRFGSDNSGNGTSGMFTGCVFLSPGAASFKNWQEVCSRCYGIVDVTRICAVVQWVTQPTGRVSFNHSTLLVSCSAGS